MWRRYWPGKDCCYLTSLPNMRDLLSKFLPTNDLILLLRVRLVFRKRGERIGGHFVRHLGPDSGRCPDVMWMWFARER